MSINDAYLLYILNDGMAENIPKMVQMTTAMLETPQAPRQNPANAQIPVQRPMNAYLLWLQAEGEILEKQRPKNEKLSSYSSRVWRDLNPEIKKFYFEEANKQSKAYEVKIAQNKQTSSIEKTKGNSSQSTAPISSSGDDWFEKMTIATAADPPFSSFNVQPKIEGMAANIPKMVQMTTAMLEKPQAPRQNPANAQIPVPQTGIRPKNTPNLAPGNPEKEKIRRAKTTIRERNRMRTLGEALDTLRDNIPITTKQQKLSKIETLRLARNYIEALQKMLQTNEQPTPLQYVHTLANGLSPTTTNMLADMWQVEPGLLAQPSQLHKSSDCCSSSQNGLLSYHSSSDPQPRSTTSYSTPMSSRSPPQHYNSHNHPHAVPLETITEWSEHHHVYQSNNFNNSQ